MNVLPGPVGQSVNPLASLLARLGGGQQFHVPTAMGQGLHPAAVQAIHNQLGGVQAPADTGLETGRPVMMHQNGQPIYYGTPEAKAAALRGLQNVAAAHGTKGPQWNAAVRAALGVLGPDFQAPPDAFSPQTLNAVRTHQQIASVYPGAGALTVPAYQGGQSDQLRAALAARLAMGAGGGL